MLGGGEVRYGREEWGKVGKGGREASGEREVRYSREKWVKEMKLG